MNNFYAGQNSKEILKLLIKAGRKHDLLVNVLCNKNDIEEISEYLWNNAIPHYIEGDDYIEKNNIFVSENEKPANFLIVYENSIRNHNYKYEKISYIGKNQDKNLDGKYWIYQNKQWKEVTKDQY